MPTPPASGSADGPAAARPSRIPWRQMDPMKILAVGAAAYLTVFLLVPLGFIIFESAAIVGGGGLADLPRFLERVATLTRNSIVLATTVTGAVLVIAVPLAIWVVKAVPCRPLFMTLLTIPLVSPPFIASFATILLFGRLGLVTQLLQAAGLPTFEVYGLPGLAITHIIHGLPLAFLTLVSGLESMPKDLEESAISLGGSLPRVIRRIVLPYMAPHMLMAGLLVFLASFGDVGAPLLLGGNYRVLPAEAYTAFMSFNVDRRVPVLLSAWIVFISAVLLYFIRRQMVRTDTTAVFEPDVYRYRSRTARGLGLAYCTAVTGFVLLPYATIVVASFGTVWGTSLLPEAFTWQHYRDLARSVEPMRNSLVLAAAATPLAVGMAVALGKAMRDWGRRAAVLDYITMLPFVVSGVVIGIGLIRLTGALHGAGLALPLLSGPALLVIAYSIRRLPYPMRVLNAGYSRIDRSLEEASRSLGASPGRTFVRVTLPQLYPAIFAATIMAFMRIITELGSTLIVYRPGWMTASLQVFHYAQEGLIGRAAAISVLLIAVVAVLTLVAQVDVPGLVARLRRREGREGHP